MIAAYWDLLTAGAFGNFRTLLEKDHAQRGDGFLPQHARQSEGGYRQRSSAGRELCARGDAALHHRSARTQHDGTEKLNGSGQPIETYGQSDITNLARVFTGYDYDFSRVTWTNVAWLDYDVPSIHFTIDPMRFTASNHSNLAVSFLGTNIPANTAGPEAMRIALDALFNHPNVGPFFAKQMIQRLVTSNPSPAYVGRVATAFNNNGSGVRGDLRAVWRAILTDVEATSPPSSVEQLRGKLREPIVRFVQWARTVGVTTTNGAFEIYDLSSSDNGLGQSAIRSPSVFNFFRPGYVPPNTAIATAGRGAPEFQLHNGNHDRRLHQLFGVDDPLGLQRREADLRRSAVDGA